MQRKNTDYNFCFIDFSSEFSKNLHWVVPENIRTPTTGGILEFRMHGGFFGLEFRMHGGVLGLEFRMHEGVSSPGIPKGGGLKTLIY